MTAKDVAAVLGLGILGGGVGMMHVPSALIVVGGLIFFLSIVSDLRGH